MHYRRIRLLRRWERKVLVTLVLICTTIFLIELRQFGVFSNYELSDEATAASYFNRLEGNLIVHENVNFRQNISGFIRITSYKIKLFNNTEEFDSKVVGNGTNSKVDLIDKSNGTDYSDKKKLESLQQTFNEKTRIELDNSLGNFSVRRVRGAQIVNGLLSNWTKKGVDGIRGRKRPNYCPLWPDKLVGKMDIETIANRTEIPADVLANIDSGGTFKPKECSPRERTAIIIPYRNREKHLEILLSHLHQVLQRQKIEYTIYVVEMAFPAQFNRGLLANVGFLTASSVRTYTCYIIHDVDLLMTDDRNIYRCGRVPRHLVASNTKYQNGLPYIRNFGGIQAFTSEQFREVNGFSNLYFGWGGEDDDMVNRIFYTRQHFSRPDSKIAAYKALEHQGDSTNPKNPHRHELVSSSTDRIEIDGLRSVSYQRLAIEFKPLYTWIYISVQEAKIMQKFSTYLEEKTEE